MDVRFELLHIGEGIAVALLAKVLRLGDVLNLDQCALLALDGLHDLNLQDAVEALCAVRPKILMDVRGSSRGWEVAEHHSDPGVAGSVQPSIEGVAQLQGVHLGINKQLLADWVRS